MILGFTVFHGVFTVFFLIRWSRRPIFLMRVGACCNLFLDFELRQVRRQSDLSFIKLLDGVRIFWGFRLLHTPVCWRSRPPSHRTDVVAKAASRRAG